MTDSKTLNVYNQDARSFAQDWHTQPAPADLHARVRQYFLPGQTADIGCGSGRDTAWLCANGYPAIGYDPSDGLLAEARRRYPTIRFARSALPELTGIADKSFANVLCETVIMHLDANLIIPSVQKLLTIMQPGGILYLSWRVTEGSDRRDEYGRLYTAFDPALVLQAVSGSHILLDEQTTSESSGKIIRRIIAQKPT